MDLGDALRWAEDHTSSADDVDRFILAAGILAAGPAQASRFPAPFNPIDPTRPRPEPPIVRWTDPSRFESPPPPSIGQDLLLPPGQMVRINFESDTGTDLIDRLVAVLEDGVGEVVASIDLGAAPTAPAWTIPIGVAVEGASGRELLAADERLAPLLRPTDLHNRRSVAHLLVGTGPWIDRWLNTTTMAAGVVVVIDDEPANRPAGFRQRAAVWAHLLSQRDPLDLALNIVFHLSHNHSVDEALHLADQSEPMTVLANPAYLHHTRITDALELAGGLETAALAADRVVESAANDGRMPAVRGPADPWGTRIYRGQTDNRLRRRRPRRNIPLQRSDRPRLAEEFRNRIFEHETHDAADAARQLETVRQAAEDREHRFLNAASELLATEPEMRARVTIDISPSSEIEPDATIAPELFPDDALDWQGSDISLDIVLFELKPEGRVHRRTVALPPRGSLREPAQFNLRWSAGPLSARVAVLYRYRFVQTMLLTVFNDDRPPAVETECVVRPADADLPTLQPHQASIILNDTAGPRAMVATDTVLAVTVPGDLEAVRAKIKSELVKIYDRPDDFSSVDGDAFRNLLTELALHGHDLWRILFGGEATAANPDEAIGSALRAADHMSILSATPTEILPLEHIYDVDFTPPLAGSAQICETALAALRRSDPTHDHAADPGPTLAKLGPHCAKVSVTGTCGSDDSTICPLGFWGLRKVIERHTKRTAPDVDVGFAVNTVPTQSRPSIDISTVLAAANPKADANPTEAWTAAQDQLTDRLGDRFSLVSDWPAIAERLGRDDDTSGLLLLLPHVERNQDEEFVLDLGVETKLAANRVDGLRLNRRHPVVLLLGCSTGAGVHPSDEFPGRFLDAGASMVLATLTLVRGRFVAPLAERLIARMLEWSVSDETPLFGEALLALRQDLLAINPMVLTVVGYGDAEWMLAGGPADPDDDTDLAGDADRTQPGDPTP